MTKPKKRAGKAQPGSPLTGVILAQAPFTPRTVVTGIVGGTFGGITLSEVSQVTAE